MSKPRGRKPFKLYTYRGQSFTLPQLAVIAGVSKRALYQRIMYLGFSVDEAVDDLSIRRGRSAVLFEHAGRKLTLHDWSLIVGVSSSTLRKRLRQGWTFAQALNVPTHEQRRRGVVSNFAPFLGTGGGSFPRDADEIAKNHSEHL